MTFEYPSLTTPSTPDPDQVVTLDGALAEPVASMVAAAGTSYTAAVTAEARMVASWIVHIGRARTDAEREALRGAFGTDELDGSARPDRALVANGAVLPSLLDLGEAAGAWRYYLSAMDLAHETVALGVYPTRDALALIDLLRSALLARIDSAGARPAPVTAATGPRAGIPPALTTPTTRAPAEPAAAVVPPPKAIARSDDPVERTRRIEQLLTDLDSLVGMQTVKAELRRLVDREMVDDLRRRRGLPVPTTSRHMIFAGPPGTGKTTVARFLARFFYLLGRLQRDHLVEVDASTMVAGYVRQTGPLVRATFDEARHSVLLIDEAYGLVGGGDNDFGREAITTLLKLAEDRRDETIVILTGYPDELGVTVDADELAQVDDGGDPPDAVPGPGTLLGANPGMPSRFPKTIFFDHLSTDELVQIVELFADEAGYRLTDGAMDRLRALFDAAPRTRSFGNARAARDLLAAAVDHQAARLAPALRAGDEPDNRALSTIRKVDVPERLPGHRVNRT